MRGHVYGFVIAEDGKIREEYRYSEDLWWDERHFPSPVVFPSREISCWQRDAVVRWGGGGGDAAGGGGGDAAGGGGCAREVVAIVTSIAACAEQLVFCCSLCPRMLVVSRRWLAPVLSFWGFVLLVPFACLSLGWSFSGCVYCPNIAQHV